MPQLRNLVVGEVSFCRKGMNQHARIALFKSADKTPLGVAKATFQEALDAQLVSQRVQNAFYGCFDNLWSRNDAFRTAMTDELAAGGDGSVAAEAWVASVKELADNAVAAAKENGGKPTDEELSGAMEKAVATYLNSKEHPPMRKFTTIPALKAAVSAFSIAKSTVQDQIDIHDSAEALGADGLAELPTEGPLAKAAPAPNTDVAKLQREVAVLKMAEPIRKHFDTLDAAGQTAFLALTPEAQAADVAKRNEGDPVVYTTAAGLEIRKSDGAVAAALAKQADADRAEIAKLRAENGTSAIEKALLPFPHVNKGVATTMLKSVANGTPDEKQAVTEALTAMNKAAGPAFRTYGVGGGADTSVEKSTAISKMDAMVDRIAKAENISKAAATVKAQNDPEFQEAYRESVANSAPADAA
jgi:hypothetical protein